MISAALVRAILEQWRAYEWTIQGFGFARTKLGKTGRIHVWDNRLRVPLVSDVHAHPWSLHSTIISGELVNQRYAEVREDIQGMQPYVRQRIKTGEGGGLVEGTETEVFLCADEPDIYFPGQSYGQHSSEVHRTLAMDGTVTLLERPMGPPLEETYVYWPRGLQWVSAEPRPPKGNWELEPIIATALQRWYTGEQ